MAEAGAKAEAARALQEQNTARRCNVRPLPAVATRPFRSDLTVEKNTIFLSNQFRGDFYTFEHEIPHPDSGEPVIRRVTVGKENDRDRGRGVLTQVHQDVFYKVLQLWQEQGHPLGQVGARSYGIVTASRYRLVSFIRGAGSDRAEDYLRVQQLLRDLAATPVVLENVYTWQGFREREGFTLLAEVRWREDDGGGRASILLSSFVTDGFLNRNYKILLGAPYDSLRAPEKDGRRGAQMEIARLLYPFLDMQLAKKDEYHSKLDNLAERFGFSRYPYKSQRYRRMLPTACALDGLPIQREQYRLRVQLDESKDGSDYMLVARRERTGKASQLALFDPAG